MTTDTTTTSKYSDVMCLVVIPANDGIITKADQAELHGTSLIYAKGSKACFVHYLTSKRGRVYDRVKSAKLSKKMLCVEVTDAQFSRRFKDEENIDGTGIRATANQFRRAFIIG